MDSSIALPLAAGLCMFLAGMKVMELALHHWAGSGLQAALERFTRTPARGMLASTGLTALLQSSTAVTVITIGLVNAGLLRFAQSLGVILGTNIGTCLTTELLGLHLGRWASELLAGSAAVWLLSLALPPVRWRRGLGLAAVATAGFACILLGLELMQAIVPALKAHGVFAWFVDRSLESLLWALAAGAALTALIHSSAVVIAMAMTLAAGGAIPTELGIALTIGANVGTCATALVAGISGSRAGMYVAWSHLALNIGGALLFYPWVAGLADLTAWMTGSPAGQIARAQTIFNVVSSLAALPACYLPVWDRLSLRLEPPPSPPNSRPSRPRL